MSVDANGLRPDPRSSHTQNTLNMRVGVATKRVSLEGEEQEAVGDKNAARIEDDVAGYPDVELDSSTTGAKRRWPLIAVGAISWMLAISVAGWTLSRGGLKQNSSSRESVAIPSAGTGAVVATSGGSVVESMGASLEDPDDPSDPNDPEHSDDSDDPEPGQAPKGRAVETRTSRADKVSSKTPAGKNRPEPLRGYVWSPTAKALVPVGGSVSAALEQPVSAANAVPAVVSSAVPAGPRMGLRVAPADTGPPAFESGRVPIGPRPILE